MKKSPLLLLAVFIAGCSSMPQTSELVLMAEANSNNSNRNNQRINFTCLKGNDSQPDNKEIYEKLMDEAIRSQTGLNKEEREDALRLLVSGKFKSDLQDIVIMTLSIAPKTTQALTGSVKTLEELPKDLHACLTTQCANPKMLIDVANRIYSDPSTKLQRQTFVALLDNRTFRLALIVYAHSNGIDIENADLDLIQSQLQKDQMIWLDWAL